MLRAVTWLLLVLNLVFFTWAQGWLRPLGWAPVEQHEPQRLAAQIRADELRVGEPEDAATPAPAAATAEPEAAVASAKQCVTVGVFDQRQMEWLRKGLAPLPMEAWSFEPGLLRPERWIIYMGRYPTADAVSRKQAELKVIQVAAERPRSPALEPGLSLGAFDTQAAAQASLTRLAARGVRTARVVQEWPELHGHVLRLPAADAAQKALVESIKAEGPATLLAGRSWTPCPESMAPSTAPQTSP